MFYFYNTFDAHEYLILTLIGNPGSGKHVTSFIIIYSQRMIPAIKYTALLALAFMVLIQPSEAQDMSGRFDEALYFPGKVLKQINDKTEALNKRLNRQTEKYLQSLSKEERKLRRRLARKDSAAARAVFGNNVVDYTKLSNAVMATPGSTGIQGKYMGHLDSLQTALRFLAQTEGRLKELPAGGVSLTNTLEQVSDLKARFNQAEEIKKILADRKRFLQDQLGRYGLGDRLNRYKKQVYYYQAQVEDYRKSFEDPSKLEAKALELISQTSLFKKFFATHSAMASLFSVPAASPGTQASGFAGLQTRNAVQQDLFQRFGSIPNLAQVVQQAPAAMPAPGALKNMINELGSQGSGGNMPEFVPNNQKVKRFKNRLEFGTNLQSAKATAFFPSTSDIGLSVGYRLNDKSVAGLGSSYKLGWGKSIRQIRITHEGIGIRSFLDYKIKGNFWVSGGAEMNYRNRFNNFEILKDYSPWQKSALAGLSKKYKVNGRIQGKMQLMYDFLWKNQIPRTQPVVFRIGYSLK